MRSTSRLGWKQAAVAGLSLFVVGLAMTAVRVQNVAHPTITPGTNVLKIPTTPGALTVEGRTEVLFSMRRATPPGIFFLLHGGVDFGMEMSRNKHLGLFIHAIQDFGPPVCSPASPYRLELGHFNGRLDIQLHHDGKPLAPLQRRVLFLRGGWRIGKELRLEWRPEIMRVISVKSTFSGLPWWAAALAILLTTTGIVLSTAAIVLRRREENGATRKINPKLRQLAILLAVGFAAALACCFIQPLLHQAGYPFNTWLFRPDKRFSDFFETFICVKPLFRPYAVVGTGNMYFPLCYALIALLPTSDILTALFLCLAFFGLVYFASAMAAAKIADGKNALLLVTVLILSYPLQYLIDRGNTEFMVYIAVIGFALCYRSGRKGFAALLLAAAICMKLYPATLIGVFLWKKEYKWLFVTGLLTALLFLYSWGICGFPVHTLLGNFHWFNREVTCHFRGVAYGHSYFGLGRAVYGLFREPLIDYSRAALIPVVLSPILFLLLLGYLFRKPRLRYWQVLYLLLCCSVMLVHTSFDYTLILLTIPLLFFIAERRAQRFDGLYVLLFVLIMIPMNWYFFPRLHFVQLSVFLRPVAITALTMLIFIDRRKRKTVRRTTARGTPKETGSGHRS